MSKRRDILNALKAALEVIDGSGPYVTNIGQNVQLHARSLSQVEIPGIAITPGGGDWPGPDERNPETQRAYAATYRRMAIELICGMPADIEQAMLVGVDMLDDIEHALKVNTRYVDLVDNSKRLARITVQNFTIEERPDGIKAIALTVNLLAEFTQT